MSPSIFRPRNFITLLVTFSGLIMTVSGFVLYVVPEGRVAYWTDWRLLGLSKQAWGSIHTNLSFLFFLVLAFHLYYNWRVLMAYLKDRLRQQFTLRRELVAALALGLVVVGGSAAQWPPFLQVMELGAAAKKAWYAGEDVQPPFPHAELMPLAELARRIDLNLPGVLDVLAEEGYAAESSEVTLKDLAQRHGASPMQLFEMIMADDRVYR
ncbi:DUF4405 domain-containing protein [Desulfuromonas sp. AOP6]|uniref:DUF4405 domain-containing protein n=1 Tax=Desulfuromonas sp. AOP6 TaxID=1566351 RepID=UPI0012880814|nr:DUF4405 domain-containing protein [Desulfuromonas sp. AOP6]BCA80700.1 hypothetical protein AOP6_2487 [Desulfuromonas sp. AOP6]